METKVAVETNGTTNGVTGKEEITAATTITSTTTTTFTTSNSSIVDTKKILKIYEFFEQSKDEVPRKEPKRFKITPPREIVPKNIFENEPVQLNQNVVRASDTFDDLASVRDSAMAKKMVKKLMMSQSASNIASYKTKDYIPVRPDTARNLKLKFENLKSMSLDLESENNNKTAMDTFDSAQPEIIYDLPRIESLRDRLRFFEDINGPRNGQLNGELPKEIGTENVAFKNLKSMSLDMDSEKFKLDLTTLRSKFENWKVEREANEKPKFRVNRFVPRRIANNVFNGNGIASEKDRSIVRDLQ